MYYRVVTDYWGDEVEFIPKDSYESVDYVNGELVEVDYKIKEVCFSKKIESCFLAISMFLKENTLYYIYRTDYTPCIDFSDSSIGDFKANREVRFRKPVKAVLIGVYDMQEEFFIAIKDLYNNCAYGEYFDNDFALDILDNHYGKIYSDIKYKTEALAKYYKELKELRIS